jgi:DNA-binding response OmpR family regulator
MKPQFGAGMTVLIIDDDPDLLPVMALTVRMLTACVVVTATNGAAGLERLVEAHPDCVIVDLKMPEIDGFQFIRAVRGDPATAATPIIILSALVQDFERYNGLAAGADRFLTKPVPPGELIAAMRAAIDASMDDRAQRQRTLAESAVPAPASERKSML